MKEGEGLVMECCGMELLFPEAEKKGGHWESVAVCPVCGLPWRAYYVKTKLE